MIKNVLLEQHLRTDEECTVYSWRSSKKHTPGRETTMLSRYIINGVLWRALHVSACELWWAFTHIHWQASDLISSYRCLRAMVNIPTDTGRMHADAGQIRSDHMYIVVADPKRAPSPLNNMKCEIQCHNIYVVSLCVCSQAKSVTRVGNVQLCSNIVF